MIQLYDNPLSPYARKVRLALYEKGIPFELHEIMTESQRNELLAVNPRAEVPALVDDAITVYDSSLICAYLEDRYPEVPLLPTDPAQRVRCRQLERLSDGPIDAVGILVFISKMVRPELEQQFPELAAKVTAAVGEVYDLLDRELSGRAFLAGDSFSIAEAAILPHVGVLAFVGYPIDASRPNLAAWLERMNERESVQRDSADAVAGWEKSQTIADPLFDNHHLHWRDHRIESLIRVGLGHWLMDELDQDRGFLPPSIGDL